MIDGTPDVVTILVYLAAGVTAAGVLWRAIFRPIRHAFAAIRDLVDEWKQVLETTRDLTELVTKNMLHTDDRLSRLEEQLNLKSLIDLESSRQTETLLARQLARQMDQEERRDRRREDRERQS